MKSTLKRSVPAWHATLIIPKPLGSSAVATSTTVEPEPQVAPPRPATPKPSPETIPPLIPSPDTQPVRPTPRGPDEPDPDTCQLTL